jgi:hypothetical protein
MYLILSADVLQEHNEIALSSILRLALRNRVFVKIDDLDTGPAQEWLGKQSTTVKAAWKVVLDSSVADLSRHRLAQSLRVTSQIKRSNWLNDPPLVVLDDAVDLAGQPRKIIMENSRADRRFLLSMVEPKLRKRLLEMEQNGSLLFVHGGGNGELRKQLQQRHIPMPGSRFVCWVLFDSDAPVPGVISQDAQALVTICTSAGIEYCCLERRAIENYLPKQAMLDSFAASEDSGVLLEQTEAFFSLTAPQRHHFHMKRGLDDKTCANSGVYDPKLPIIKKIKNGFKAVDLADIYPEEDEAEMEMMFRYLSAENAQAELNDPIKILKAMIRSPR